MPQGVQLQLRGSLMPRAWAPMQVRAVGMALFRLFLRFSIFLNYDRTECYPAITSVKVKRVPGSVRSPRRVVILGYPQNPEE